MNVPAGSKGGRALSVNAGFKCRLRNLATLDECRLVVELEKEVWGYTDIEDVVPALMLMLTAKRGAILIGAFDPEDTLVAFVYSFPGFKAGRPMQWSHMLGVRHSHRGAGLGRLLKLEQRRQALEMGLDLIEWTYDPMQALNAHLNFARLGAIVRDYEINVYGESSSLLHRGTPTDRFIAEWELRSPHVERRIAPPPGEPMHSHDVTDAGAVNAIRHRASGPEPGKPDLSLTCPRLTVEIPVGFSEMQVHQVDLARAWRAATREIFTTYLGRGYRVVDFWLDQERGKGTYLLARS
jgi:predicted GNAT superfamily acetyltransferase